MTKPKKKEKVKEVDTRKTTDTFCKAVSGWTGNEKPKKKEAKKQLRNEFEEASLDEENGFWTSKGTGFEVNKDKLFEWIWKRLNKP